MKTRPARVERVLAYLCEGVARLPGETLEARLGEWLDSSTRFVAFTEAHSDKIRKKLRTAVEPGARGDVLAELEAAFLLLADRRVDLAFEAYGSGRRGPDFTVTFRTNHRFNLEVTRPRARAAEAGAAAITNALLVKLRQLPADAPNVLFLASGLANTDNEVAVAVRSLKLRADRGEEAAFAERGLSTREFQVLHRRMALLLVGSTASAGIHAWPNPEARRRLPDGAASACMAALAGTRWATE